MSSFDPNSTDAMLATIVQQLKDQKETSAAILAQVMKTNGRVTSLENEKQFQRGVTATISVIVSSAFAWLLRK